MSSHKILPATVAWVALVVRVAATASAETRYVDYLIREDASDPDSKVIYIFSLGIEEVDRDGGWIGWLIDEVAIVKLDSLGEVEAYWIEYAPYVPTLDGLWWVQHEDVEKPKGKEFHRTPSLAGTALANDPNDDNMEYDFVGATFTGQSPRYDESVSAMTYDLRREGAAEPEEEGVEEPGRIEDLSPVPSYL